MNRFIRSLELLFRSEDNYWYANKVLFDFSADKGKLIQLNG
jgi:hypothetical protein